MLWCPYTIYHEFQFRFGLSFVAYFLSWLIPRYKTPPDAKAVTSDNLTDCTALTKLSEICKKYANRQTKRDRDREREKERKSEGTAWNYERERQAKSLAFEETFLFLGDMPSVGRLTHLAWLVRISGLSISFESHRSFSSLFCLLDFDFYVLFHVYPLPPRAVCNTILYYSKPLANIFTLFDVIYDGKLSNWLC